MHNVLDKGSKSIKSSKPDEDWCRFLYTADEFLVAYTVIPPRLMISLFLVGHAAELYLKAVFTKQTGNIDKAVRYGHRIKELFIKCKENDKSFLPDLDYKRLENDVEYRKEKHLELYYVGKYLADLKYLGVSFSEMRDLQRYGPNYEWANFFRRIRLYLKYPPKGHKDFLKDNLNDLGLSDQHKNYLGIILGKVGNLYKC
ncbi:MAG: hypothetical protein PHW98_05155 [Candidatus Omnitrophica bacterium]|nr:hypothetical protein [Candidatus Omnitrophota bacterium]